jgi:hypothetical protein
VIRGRSSSFALGVLVGSSWLLACVDETAAAAQLSPSPYVDYSCIGFSVLESMVKRTKLLSADSEGDR